VNPWIIAICGDPGHGSWRCSHTASPTLPLPAHRRIHILPAGPGETLGCVLLLVSNALVLPRPASPHVVRHPPYPHGLRLPVTVSSFLCGFAPNLPALIIFRILQGAGAGACTASEQAEFLLITFPTGKT